MKVAIVHDYIKEYGGAERVLEALHDIWPDSTVFTSLFLPQYLGPHLNKFRGWKIKTSIFQNVPFSEKLISPLRLFSKSIFSSFDLSEFDLIIVSATGAYIPNFVKKGKAKQICYCHTPPRYLYGYPTARNWRKTLWGKAIGEFVNHFLRLQDFASSSNPDYYIANSDETRKRIAKFYRREATVIYPPVSLADKLNSNIKTKISNTKGEYYLAGGRLARAKHIDLIISVFNKLKLPLVVFGKAFAGYESELRTMAGPNIEFKGEVDDRALSALYKNAKALIFASEYEDFGIMPVEAQANGVPVVALKQGGVTESVIEGKTGVFFEELNDESLTGAIKKLGKCKIMPDVCRENAKRFSSARFKKEITKFIADRKIH